MDFWGVEVKKGLTEIIKVPSGTALHLTLSCLGPNTRLDERVFLECEVDHSKVILCCLTAGKVDNVILKHVFASHHASITLSVIGGNLDSNASIFVTGYLNIEEDPGELLEHYEDDEEIPYSSDEYGSITGSDYYDDDVEGEFYDDDEDEGEFYDDEEYDEDDYDQEGEYYDDEDEDEDDDEDVQYYRPPSLGYMPRHAPSRVYFDTGRGRARVQKIYDDDEDSDVAPPLIPATPTDPAAKPASTEKKTQPSPKPTPEGKKKQNKPEKKKQHKHKHGEKKHGEKKHGEKKHGEKHKHHHGKSEASKKSKKHKKHSEQPPSKKRKHSS